MSPKTSRMAEEEADEDTRGCRGCFGWFFRLFKRKKRGRRSKHKDPESSLVPLASNTALLENSKEENENEMTVAEINEVKVIEEENGAAVAAEDVGEARQAELDEVEVAEEQEEQEPKVVKTWAEEVDEAEEKGLDVFAPEISCLPHVAAIHSDTEASTENEATAAAATEASVAASVATAAAEATKITMSVTQRRRARRKALAARKASAESEAASLENEAPAAAAAETTPPADSTEQPQASEGTPVWPAPSVGVHGSDGPPFVPEAPTAAAITSAAGRRRARRKALAARVKSEARLAASTEEPPAPDRTPVWPSPSVRVSGSDGRPSVTTWEEAAYGAFHAQRQRPAGRGSAASIQKPPAPDRTPVWPSPSVRVFGSDGRPLVTTWEEAAYGAFHAQRHYSGPCRGGQGSN